LSILDNNTNTILNSNIHQFVSKLDYIPKSFLGTNQNISTESRPTKSSITKCDMEREKKNTTNFSSFPFKPPQLNVSRDRLSQLLISFIILKKPCLCVKRHSVWSVGES